MLDTGLTDKVVLVTGAGAGIGAATARAFAAQGARVAVHFLPVPESPPTEVAHELPDRETARRLAAELPGAVAVGMDLAEEHAAAGLLDEVERRLGPVDVLVNNAAHCASPDTIDTLTAVSLQRHYRVNVTAPALLTSELARRHDPSREAPCVVNISTDAARAFPGQLGYGTSKAALEAFTRGAALDLAAVGIRVNAVAPGPVQTGWMDDELLAHVRDIVPLGRAGEPAEIADAVLFLASHQARFVTGQVLQAAGGHAL
ncbi:SDR family NAD(P)-dependent oxidoreductase [Streptomyces oceani]|uniref:Short-chain dehydrogenase n=1 Tax=Streptomyces oceani TaxID=1075402 RepID=A0A1E7KGZ8_9ACTN|nr:SDR family oxidoreductase [Streptomyces oceani]OEV03146.1 short-chain dehydrogenase [Streptomyces oceani]